ncbi:hypothetical protein BDR05DRAFT_1000401 [Suillus weaverae]|nr:hypothetical protein BDR05DRAFT_1000401 [Suillus weaverae]
MSSQQSSNSSLENHCSQLELHHKRALIESTLLSLPCTLPLDHFFSEDQTALSLITAYRSADMAMSYAQTISSPAEEATKRSITYHMTKIKLILADRLLDRGFEQALTPSMISEISESGHLLSVEPLRYPSQETPKSPSESSNESTPVPIPTVSQLAEKLEIQSLLESDYPDPLPLPLLHSSKKKIPNPTFLHLHLTLELPRKRPLEIGTELTIPPSHVATVSKKGTIRSTALVTSAENAISTHPNTSPLIAPHLEADALPLLNPEHGLSIIS